MDVRRKTKKIAMIIKQFSDKYGVDYSVVQRASYTIVKDFHYPKKRYRHEFDEKELGSAVKAELERIIKRHETTLNKRQNELNVIYDSFE